MSIYDLHTTEMTKATLTADALADMQISKLFTILDFEDVDLNQTSANDSNIINGSFSIQRDLISSDKIEFGSAIASKLDVIIDNSDGSYDSFNFKGSSVTVYCYWYNTHNAQITSFSNNGSGTVKATCTHGLFTEGTTNIIITNSTDYDGQYEITYVDSTHFTFTHAWTQTRTGNIITNYYMLLGLFFVDSSPIKNYQIKISAMDKLIEFDRLYNSTLSYPATLSEIYSDVILNINISSATLNSTLVDYMDSITVAVRPNDNNITYRDVIRWIAELCLCCAYIDNEFKLALSWYDMPSDAQFNTTGHEFGTITTAERFSSEIDADDITINAFDFSYIQDGVQERLAPDDNYPMKIEGNLLANFTDASALAVGVYFITRILGIDAGPPETYNKFTYRPFKCDTISMPHIMPLDKITFVDKDNVSHTTYCTNSTFRLNGNTTIEGRGKTLEREMLATVSPFTPQQRAIATSPMTLKNNKSLFGTETDGSKINLTKVSANDNVVLGDTTQSGMSIICGHDEIRFYINSALVGSIRSDGIYNHSNVKVVSL